MGLLRQIEVSGSEVRVEIFGLGFGLNL